MFVWAQKCCASWNFYRVDYICTSRETMSPWKFLWKAITWQSPTKPETNYFRECPLAFCKLLPSRSVRNILSTVARRICTWNASFCATKSIFTDDLQQLRWKFDVIGENESLARNIVNVCLERRNLLTLCHLRRLCSPLWDTYVKSFTSFIFANLINSHSDVRSRPVPPGFFCCSKISLVCPGRTTIRMEWWVNRERIE